MARNVVGIDLGTTNSALAHASLPEGDKGSGGVRVDTVAQLVAPGSVLPRPTLPSFLYLAGAHELAAGATRLPWSDGDTPIIAGELARIQGAPGAGAFGVVGQELAVPCARRSTGGDFAVGRRRRRQRRRRA